MILKYMHIVIPECLEYLKYTFEQVNTLPEDPEDDVKITYLDRCGVSAEKYAIVGKFNRFSYL